MAYSPPPHEKHPSSFDGGALGRDEKKRWSGDEKAAPMIDEKKTWTGSGEKHASTTHQDRTWGGDDKATLADEALARQLQDEWEHEGSQSSSSALKAFGNLTKESGDEKSRQQSTPYAPPTGLPPGSPTRQSLVTTHSGNTRPGPAHTNPLVEAGKLRAMNEVSPPRKRKYRLHPAESM